MQSQLSQQQQPLEHLVSVKQLQQPVVEKQRANPKKTPIIYFIVNSFKLLFLKVYILAWTKN